MKTLIALCTIERAIAPGKPGDKNAGTPPVKPQIQIIRAGSYFTAKDTTEEDDLIARGAAREVPKKDTEAKTVISPNVEEANRQAEIAAARAKEEAAARAAKNAELEEAKRAQREQERIDAEIAARKKQEEDDAAAATKKKSDDAAAAKKIEDDKAAAAAAKKKTTSAKKADSDSADDLV